MDGRIVGAKLGLMVVGNLEGGSVGMSLGVAVDGCGVGLYDGHLEGRLKPDKQENKQS
jgi:hypothetical protein